MLDELRARVMTSATLGLKDAGVMGEEGGANGRLLIVEDRPGLAELLVTALKELHSVEVESDAQAALIRLAEGEYDLAVVGLDLAGFDALRLCSQLRSLERTRALPILLAAEPEGRARILRALDLGVNDYLLRPIDRNELVARVRTQLRRKRYADALRENMQHALELAVVDALTGLNNRRFLESHLASALDRAAHVGLPLSLMLVDVDHFKSVNDTHGHDVGDEVLRTLAQRIRRVVRSADLVCRLGGEEFVIVMSDTPLSVAARIAERVRASVQSSPFKIGAPAGLLSVTVSIGLAERGAGANPDALMRRADKALYDSKAAGRNRVTASAA